MLPLPPRTLSEQMKIAMPVIRQVLSDITSEDGYTVPSNYQEGRLPFISQRKEFEILLSIQNIQTIGQGDGRSVLQQIGPNQYAEIEMLSNLKFITVRVRINFDNLKDDVNAWCTMNLISDRLTRTSVLERFEQVNIGVISTSDARNVSFNFRGRTINAFEMDIVFSTTTNDVDLDTGYTLIESLQLNSELTSQETLVSYDIDGYLS